MPENWQFEKDNSGFILTRNANGDITSIEANPDGIGVTAWLKNICLTQLQNSCKKNVILLLQM